MTDRCLWQIDGARKLQRHVLRQHLMPPMSSLTLRVTEHSYPLYAKQVIAPLKAHQDFAPQQGSLQHE